MVAQCWPESARARPGRMNSTLPVQRARNRHPVVLYPEEQ
jgi:hypothetical protein